MNSQKPKIFIGSSGQGYEVAKQVKKHLSSVAECFLWKESGVWEPNVSTFDNLLKNAGLFDFGVFVATSDDLTLTKGQIVIEPRDNVILEMALFLGALGKDKAFLLVEEGVKLPSDFSGIFMPQFKKGDETSLIEACQTYSEKIEEYYEFGHLSLYPTTALAMGYYKNFIAGLVESAQAPEILEFNDVQYTEFKLRIVIPKDLEGSIREKATLFYKRNGFVENSLRTKYRKHPSWFQLDPESAPVAIMYDMPSTLTGIDDAIEMVLHKGFQGRTKLQKMIEERELNNFRRVLQIQLNKSPFAASFVEFCDEF